MLPLFLKGLILLIFFTIHGIGLLYELYKKYDLYDALAHFTGGVVLGVIIGNAFAAMFLILLWEVLEQYFFKSGSGSFHETYVNKARDIFFGLLGFIVGAYFLG